MIGDEYEGDASWGVRWAEAGRPPVCREYGDEEQARAMYVHLTQRYAEMGRSDRPELIRARLTWEVVGANPDAGAGSVCRYCDDKITFDLDKGWIADPSSPVCYPSKSGMHYPVEPVEGIDF